MNNTFLATEAKEVLKQLAHFIEQLSFDEYTEKLALLSNSSIGEHTRHIIELFQQLLNGYEIGNINYDNRKRNINLQENIDFAIESIAKIIKDIEKTNKTLHITTLYNNQEISIESNYYRELMYNIEHCIHHQAIIKIAFLQFGTAKIDENFGVAKSTIKFRTQCAQ